MSIVGLCQCVTHQDYIQYCNECLCKSKAVAAGGAYLQTFDPPWLFAVAVSPFRPTLEIYNMDQHGHQTAQSWKENPFPIIMMAVTVQFARDSFETTSLPGGIKLWDLGFTDSLCKWYFDYLWQFQLILYIHIYIYVRWPDVSEARFEQLCLVNVGFCRCFFFKILQLMVSASWRRP